MLYISIITAVLIVAIALRFLAEDDDPGNATVHEQQDETRDDGEPDLMTARAA